MAKVIIYCSNWCPFCVRAKTLLSNKGASFEEISVDGKPDVRAQMAKKAGRTSVPQIWIDELHVGGCDELFALPLRSKANSSDRKSVV